MCIIYSILLCTGGTVIDFEDILIYDTKKGEGEREKIYYIVLIENKDDIYCEKKNASDEIVSYIWILDCISNAEVVNIDKYRISNT